MSLTLSNVLAAMALLAAFCSGLAHAEQCAVPADALTNLGRSISDGRTVAPGELTSVDFVEPGESVRYVRLQIKPKVPAGAKWRLVVRDEKLRIVDTLYDDTGSPDMPQWSRRLYVPAGRVYLDLDASIAQTRIEVSRAIIMPESVKVTYYSRQNLTSYGFGPLYSDPKTELRRIGDHVGFLNVTWGGESWCCSGVAVAEDLVLTNWHCGGNAKKMPAEGMWSPEVCAGTFVDFSWDGDAIDREFTCTEVVDKNEVGDFALIRVRPLRGIDRLVAPALRTSGPRQGEQIRIVHHPACMAKQISRDCAVRDDRVAGWRTGATEDFTYPCDTEGGSSGAPVFDAENRLIGLHHLGFQEKGGKCDMLNKAVGLEGVLGSMKPDLAKLFRQLMKD